MSDSISMNQVTIRPFDERDSGLVYQSWLKSYRHSVFAKQMRVSIYFSEHRHVINALIAGAEVVCAVDPEDPSHIYGWACIDSTGRSPIVHYVFVKPPYRGVGIAKRLLRTIEGRPFFYTHVTREIDRERIGGTYVPHLAFKGLIAA